MSANINVSTASTDMAARPTTAFQRFDTYADIRKDKPLLFGDSGEISLMYNSTRDCFVIDGQGQGIDIRGDGMARDRYTLTKVLGGKLVQLTASQAYTTDNDFELLGTNAANGNCTNYAEGGILFTTAGADGDQNILVPLLTANRTPWTSVTWGTNQLTRWEAVIQTAASVANIKIWGGLKLTNTPVVATDNDQAYFLFDTTAGASPTLWHWVYSIANVDTDTAVSSSLVAAVAANTTYHLVIDIDSSRIARFYINGLLVGTSTALTSGNLIPYVGVAANGAAAAKSLRVLKTAISRKAFA